MDYLFIGGSNDGERAQVPAHIGRVFRKHKFEPGRVEVYETLTIGTPDHLFTVFVFHKLRAHEVMELLIEKYPAPQISTMKLLLTQEMVDLAQAIDDGEPCGAGGSPTAHPVCTWPRGFFKDGWLAEEESGSIYWHGEKPTATSRGWSSEDWRHIETTVLVNPISFRPDLPWNQRIVKVGPQAETPRCPNDTDGDGNCHICARSGICHFKSQRTANS